MSVETEILDIKKSLARIETAVIGDEKAGIQGLAMRTVDLENYKKQDQRLKHKIAGGLFISVPILTAFWEYIKHKLQN